MLIERGAGEGIKYSDLHYTEAGAQAVDAAEVFQCDVVLKITPLNGEEAALIRPGVFLLTLLQPQYQSASVVKLLMQKKVTAVAIDRVTDEQGRCLFADILDEIDGRAAIVLASGEAVAKYGLKPMAKMIGWGQGGVDPKIMGVGPVVASRNAMKKAGVTIDDIDLIEANEAFAAQSIAVARELHFDMSKVNVNGGAIALGHPVGASGARIIVTLLHEMQKRPEAKKGLATLCIGGGMGTAVVFEKC